MNLRQIKDLVYILTLKEIKTRYKNNVLGYVWSLANPLAYATIFYFAFGIIFRFDMENYALFLICGLFPWQWMSNSAITSAGVFLNSSNLIKKAIFPRYILPVASCLQEGFHFLMTIPVILVFMVIFGVDIEPIVIIGVPVLILIQYITVLGLSLIIGTTNVFFRDINYIVQVMFQMFFYLTPILYPISNVPEEYLYYFEWNPFVPLVMAWKDLFLDGAMDLDTVKDSAIVSFIFLGMGVFVYRRMSWRFAECM